MALCAVCAAAGAQSLPSLYVPSDPAAGAVAGVQQLAGSRSSLLERDAASMSLMDGNLDASVSYGMWQPAAMNDKIIGAGAAARLGKKFALGAAVRMFNQPSYDLVDDNGVTAQVNGTFAPKDLVMGLGASLLLSECLSVGVTAKFVSSKLGASAEASAVCADVSAAFVKGGLRSSLNVRNLGGKVSYGTETSSALPMMASASAAYAFNDALEAGAQIDYMLCGAFAAGLGAQYRIKDIVAFRTGYHFGAPDAGIPSYASVGLGAGFAGISLNAAYLLASGSLEGTMLFGLGYSF